MILPLPLDIHTTTAAAERATSGDTATAASAGDAESATSADTATAASAGDSERATSAVHRRGVCIGLSSADSMPAAGSMHTKAVKPNLCRKVRY